MAVKQKMRALLKLVRAHGTAVTAALAFILSSYQFLQNWWKSHDLQILLAVPLSPSSHDINVVFLNQGKAAELILGIEPALHWVEEKAGTTNSICDFGEFLEHTPELIPPNEITVKHYQNFSLFIDELKRRDKGNFDRFFGKVYFGLRISFYASNGKVMSRFIKLGYFMNNLPGINNPKLYYLATQKPIHAIKLEPYGIFEQLWRQWLPDPAFKGTVDCGTYDE